MPSYDRIAGLPLQVDGYQLDGLSRWVSSGMERLRTVIRLHGAGEVGVGADVVYDADDHRRQPDTGPVLDLGGSSTLDAFADRLGAPIHSVADVEHSPPRPGPSISSRRASARSAR